MDNIKHTVGEPSSAGQIPRLKKHEILKESITCLESEITNLRSLLSDIRGCPEVTKEATEPRTLNNLKEVLEFIPQDINEISANIGTIVRELREILL